MQATFYTYSKRKNSTAQPTGGDDIEISLKEPCSVLSPILELQTIPDPSGWNYCYLMDFGRYYYVGDWTYYRGTWSATCEVDPLASWRAQIKSQTLFVLYSATEYNLQVLDTRLAATAEYDRQVTTEAFAGAKANAQIQPQGYFALTVLAGTSTWSTGAATTYFLTYQQMQMFARELLQPDGWDALKQFFTNPVDGIIDCYYLPVDVGQYIDLTTSQPISVGDHTFSSQGYLGQATNLAVKSKHITMEIPWYYDDFRRLSPYTEVSLFVPFCGTKSLATELLSDVEAILIDYSLDPNTGSVQALAYVKQEVVEEFSGNCRVSLPIGQSQARVDSILGGAAGGITAIGGIATGNPLAVAHGVISGISSAVTPTSQKVAGGFSGSVLGAILGNDVSRWQQFHLITTSRITSDEPDNMRPVVGNALARTVSLSGLSGYVQTSGASCNIQCFASELSSINQMLDAGLYLE